MRKLSIFVLTALTGIALACSDRLPTSPGTRAQRGEWGSNQVSLTIKDSSATLQFHSDGGCYGAYGEIDQPIPTGRFTRPGTFTQLMGVAPGKIEYAAEYSGMVDVNQVSITATVGQQAFGPFSLTFGVNTTRGPCLYP